MNELVEEDHSLLFAHRTTLRHDSHLNQILHVCVLPSDMGLFVSSHRMILIILWIRICFLVRLQFRVAP